MKRYKWVLSPSKFEDSTGCPCYERVQADTEYSIAGTNLHDAMEKDTPIESLDVTAEEAGYLTFCRNELEKIKSAYSLVWEELEVRVKETTNNPRGIIDWLGLTDTGLLIIIDYKFGAMRVPSPKENYQLKAYLKAACVYLEDQPELDLPEITEAMAGIIQPQLELIDIEEFTLEEIEEGIKECRDINDRHADPFKQPDPSNPDKCASCANFAACPAVNSAIDKFVDQAALLPMPSQLAPNAIVSERDRIIAQDLAKILETWVEQVKKNNRAYAIEHGGTLGGVYNMTERAGGVAIDSVKDLTDVLIAKGWISSAEEMLDLVKVSQAGVVAGLVEKITTKEPASQVKLAIKEIFHEIGTPLPPIPVFRRGGKKQIAAAIDNLDIPGLANPFHD
jgi:CRISPR/Cas system-associated exonuclease Cas4 (RecB family)